MPLGNVIKEFTRDKELDWHQTFKATFKTWQQWNSIFKKLKDKKCRPRILYSANLSFKYQGY